MRTIRDFQAAKTSRRVAYRYLYARLFRAMSMGEAKEILGFPPDANPSADEVKRMYRTKAFENHPDRGGDPSKMVELNVAKDILEGKARPTGPSSSPSYGGGTPYDYGSEPVQPREKPDPVRVTWDEAKQAAGVPEADWKFKTANAYGGYGDTTISGHVVCGKLGDALVFVAVEYYSTSNAFTGSDIEEYWMDVVKTQGTIRDTAPKVIRQMFGRFPHLKKKYNAKVDILPDGISFDKTKSYHGRTVSFKDAMALIGEIDQNDPWAQRKLTIQIITHSRRGMDDRNYDVELVVNGKGYMLRKDNADKMQENYGRVLRAIFGDYYYDKSKKLLTRSKNGPKAMQWMVNNLHGEPDDLMAALKAAIEQTGGRRR